jgi:ectoine hydroxylase-related dioxygenase (phytanoyl-CoA dioxygenase family)
MENYFRTFDDLAEKIEKFSDSIRELVKINPRYEQLLGYPNTEVITDQVLKTIFGASFFQLGVEEALVRFRSHRYFTDALGIDLLPTVDELYEFYRILEKKTSSTPEKIYSAFAQVHGPVTPLGVETSIDYDFLDANGYLIIENVLDVSICDRVNELTLRIADHESNSLKKGYVYGSGNMQRVYSLISKHDLYYTLLGHPIVDCVMRHMFHRETFHNKYYLTSFHANILKTSSENQIWHIDANVPDPIPPWIMRSNSNYITQDYTRECGATEIIPGSHKWSKKPNAKEAETFYTEGLSRFIEAPKGSLAFWHGHLWHRSGQNVTGKSRVALLGAYAASFLRELSLEENHHLNLDVNQIQHMPNKIKRIIGLNHGAKFYY